MLKVKTLVNNQNVPSNSIGQVVRTEKGENGVIYYYVKFWFYSGTFRYAENDITAPNAVQDIEKD